MANPEGTLVDSHRMSMETHSVDSNTELALGRLTWLLVPVGVIVAGLVVIVLAGHGGSWSGGVLSAGAAVWLARETRERLRDRPAPGLRSPQSRTRDVLEPLVDAGWRFVTDVPGPDGPVDHIAVGPGGVIVLESLAPRGVVSMRGGDPILESPGDGPGSPTLQRLRPRALADAGAVRENVRRLTGRRVWVQAAVVFWSDFPQGVVTDGRCVFIHGSRLSEWLSRRPHQLDDGQIDDVFIDVELLQSAPGALSLPLAV